MKFVLHASALHAADQTLTQIDRIVDRAADEVHRIEIPDADRLKASPWYSTARPTRRKLVTTAAATPPRRRQADSIHRKCMDVLDPESAEVAARLAFAPLTILVEDREADGVLLELLIEKMGSEELRKLWNAGKICTPRGVEIDTAGGIGAMPERVRRAVADALAERRPARMFVICDSDRRWPGDAGHATEASREALRTECKTQGIRLHVLKKRAAENYVPNEVVVAVRDLPKNSGNVERFNALLRRSPVQRDHFPIKDGLGEAELTDAIDAGLYQSCEIEDLKLLKERLFPKRPRLLKLLYLERRADFSESGFRQRDGAGEIDLLLDALIEEA